MKRLTRFYRHIYRELLRADIRQRWEVAFLALALVTLLAYKLAGVYLTEYKEMLRVSGVLLCTLALLMQVPISQQQPQLRRSFLIYLAIGLLVLGVFWQNDLFFLGVGMFIITFLPPYKSVDPENKQQVIN